MLSDDSDVDDIHTLTINEHYAKAFEYRKEREELAKRMSKSCKGGARPTLTLLAPSQGKVRL